MLSFDFITLQRRVVLVINLIADIVLYLSRSVPEAAREGLRAQERVPSRRAAHVPAAGARAGRRERGRPAAGILGILVFWLRVFVLFVLVVVGPALEQGRRRVRVHPGHVAQREL